MPLILLLGIPIAVIVLFIGIMNLPDEEKTSEVKKEPAKTLKKKKRS